MTSLLTILSFFLFGLLIWSLNRKYKNHPMLPAMFIGMASKVAAGIALGLIYYYYYQEGDTILYFNGAIRMSSLARNDFFVYIDMLLNSRGAPLELAMSHQPRALFFTKVLSFVCLLTNDNYWLSSVYFSLFSFSGLWSLANVLIKINNNKSAALLAFIFFPTVLFWSSGILKESISIGALAFLTSSVIKYSYRLKRFNIALFLLELVLLLLLWKIKYYYAGLFLIVIVPLSVTFIVKNYFSGLFKNYTRQLAVYFTLMISTVFLVSLLHPNFYLSRILGVIVESHDEILALSGNGKVIHFNNLTATWESIIYNLPLAIFSGLFRPLIIEGSSWLELAAGFDNLIILVLLLTAMASLPKSISDEAKIFLSAALSYALLMSAFLALSTPNFGTLMRFKVGFLPFFIYLLAIENPIIKWVNRKIF